MSEKPEKEYAARCPICGSSGEHINELHYKFDVWMENQLRKRLIPNPEYQTASHELNIPTCEHLVAEVEYSNYGRDERDLAKAIGPKDRIVERFNFCPRCGERL